MSYPLPDWLPPVIKSRLRTLKMSLSELARRADIPLTTQCDILRSNKNESYSKLIDMLEALEYDLRGPEWDLIKELSSRNDLQEPSESRRISSSKELSNFYLYKTYTVTYANVAA